MLQLIKIFFTISLIPAGLLGQSIPKNSETIPIGIPVGFILPKLQYPIDFDGQIGTTEWNQIDTLLMASHWPAFAAEPNARTQFRVAYDETYLYFSAMCFDNPASIQGSSFERDNWNMTMDQVALILDTYNDNENGVIFVVSPTGSRIDVSARNDAQGDAPIDLSWNSFWEARSSINDNGWSTEARIPLTSLRFQPGDGSVTMGLITYRYIARERQMDIFPSIPPDWGFWSFIKLSKAQDVQFVKKEHKRPWFISPYVLAGLGYHHIIPDGIHYPDKIKDHPITAGLDVQHALSDNMNLDLTFNTDFAQVEADDQVVNLSRFSLFYPEKRRFFLERSSIMDFGFENNNRLFYSRRIGIDNGMIVPLWGGARMVGRLKNYDIGVLTMESRGQEGSSSENYSVWRLRRKVSNNNSYIGGLLTTQTDWKGKLQLAYGVDGIINLFKNDYLKVNLASTYENADTTTAAWGNDRKRIHILWENRSQVGFNYTLSYSQVDKNYTPSLGFEERYNFRAIGDRLSYGWFTKNHRSLRYMSVNLNAKTYFSGTTKRMESFQVSPSFFMEWKKNSSFKITYNHFYDDVPEAFDLSGQVSIKAAIYTNRDLTFNYQTPSVYYLNTKIDVIAGTFYGGKRFSGGFTPSYVISKFITLSGFYQYNYITFDNQPDYLAHIGRLKVSTSLNVKLSMNAFVQLNSLTGVSAVNFRLRFNPKDGNDLYLVYNEVLNNSGKSDPLLPFSDSRAVIIKYIHTFLVSR